MIITVTILEKGGAEGWTSLMTTYTGMREWSVDLLFDVIMSQGDSTTVQHTNTHVHVSQWKVTISHPERDVSLLMGGENEWFFLKWIEINSNLWIANDAADCYLSFTNRRIDLDNQNVLSIIQWTNRTAVVITTKSDACSSDAASHQFTGWVYPIKV